MYYVFNFGFFEIKCSKYAYFQLKGEQFFIFQANAKQRYRQNIKNTNTCGEY